MKLYYYRAAEGNFGDDLNGWLWPKLLPGIFDEDGRVLFIGIGTILDDRLPEEPVKIIFGSGVGYPNRLPDRNERLRIRALRGPFSARALGVSPDLAITDPAILARLLFKVPSAKTHRFSYMPHFKSANVEKWRTVCEGAGLHYIDSRADVETCLREIARSEILISEAMHGAIVADAFRVPWMVVRANNYFNEGEMYTFKWDDWCASLGLPSRSYPLLPLWERSPNEGTVQRLKQRVKEGYVISRLKWLMRRGRPCLSADGMIERSVSRFQERLEAFRREPDGG